MGMLMSMIEGDATDHQERLDYWQEGCRRFPGLVADSLNKKVDAMLQHNW